MAHGPNGSPMLGRRTVHSPSASPEGSLNHRHLPDPSATNTRDESFVKNTPPRTQSNSSTSLSASRSLSLNGPGVSRGAFWGEFAPNATYRPFGETKP